MKNDLRHCPVCRATDPEIIADLPEVPVHCNRLWSTPEAARSAPRGSLRLAFCRACTHIYNLAFLPERMEYGGEYENSLHFSPHFQDYSRSLAAYLVERFELRHRRILEIGCGKGEFLAQLVELGDLRGVGFDPSFQPGRIASETAARIEVFREIYSPGQCEVEADFICCRHVLEHLADPVGFLTELRHSTARRQIPVFFEVPNILFTLREVGIWELIYEHPSYFGPESLRRVFAEAGFEVQGVREAFAGQFLCLEAVALPGERTAPAGADSSEILPLVDRFRELFPARMAAWRQTLAMLRRMGRRAAIWGAGSKGVTFVNLLPPGEEIIGAVDVNPRKQGKFLAGTGQPVLAPEALAAQAPDVVIVMNPAYRREIEHHLERLSLFPELHVV